MLNQFKNRPDSEHEQVLIRVVLTFFTLVFLLVSYQITGATQNRTEALTATLLYLSFSLGLVIVLWFDVAPSPTRRVLGIVMDTFIISYALSITGDVGAPLYGAYLWVTIANGFRFGKKYLYLAQALSVVGFSYVITTGTFWREYPMFAVGLLIWLLVIPPYISVLLNRLSAAVDKAKQADMAKNHFLANMSHELRTPLNAIIGYSEMLREDLHAEGKTEYANDLKHIHQSGTHLLGLINEILDLSKIEEGRMDVFYENINVRELATDVAATLYPLAEKNGNQLTVDIPYGSMILHTDVTKLRQVLFNLLSNACKFTHKGHVNLTVSRQTMTTATGSEDCLAFKVTDDGIGVASDKIESIFLPFHQESLITSKDFGGTGLGLTISKQFCELMGGKLLVKSIKGEGSTFTVLLPLYPPAFTEADAA